jgi:hypothetical protein
MVKMRKWGHILKFVALFSILSGPWHLGCLGNSGPWHFGGVWNSSHHHWWPTSTYNISGTVTYAGTGLGGVTMTLSGAATNTVTTDSNGNYSFTGLVNGSYTVTPSLAGYIFTPNIYPVTIGDADVTGIDFVATSLVVNPTDVSIMIDPVAQTVSLSTTPGADAGSVGTMQVSLSIYAPYGYDNVFYGNRLLLFVSVTDDNINTDLDSVRLQLSDLGSDTVTPADYNGTIPGLEGLAGVHLSGGTDSSGLPYYNFGDFYAANRALTQNGSYTSWQWALGFDLDSLTKPVTITGKILGNLPEPNDSTAKITIQPYLQDMTTNSVVIMWETDTESHAKVFYGPYPSCGDSAEGSVARYQTMEYVPSGQPQVFNLIVHEVVVSGLQPGVTYYYQVRAAKTPSSVNHFQTLTDQIKPYFRFAVYGDTRNDGTNGSSYDANHSALINRMLLYDHDFVVHSGDQALNSYSSEYRRNFFNIEEPLISVFPMFPVHGNHDGISSDVVWYKEYMETPPNNTDPTLSKLCYSFKYQNSYFIFLDTDGPPSLAQGDSIYNWLATVLADAYNDPDRQFTFFFSHEPFYAGWPHMENSLPALSYIAPLFQTYDVSAGFAGHIHLYSRMDVSGKPYIITAGGGAPFEFQGVAPDPSLLAEEAALSGETVTQMYYDWRIEFVDVEVGNGYFQVSAYDKDGTLFDSVLYTK